VDDYINNIGTTSNFNFIFSTGSFSISFWIKKSLNDSRYAIAGNTLTNAEKGFWIVAEYGIPDFGNNCLRFQVSAATGPTNTKLIAGSTNDDTLGTNWTYCTFTCQNPDKIGQWYINGVASTTTTRMPSNFTQASYYSGPANRTLNVGRSNSGATTLPFNGNISQFYIYDRSLNASEVLQNYNATKTRFGL
jgi:hypothetical protein